MKTYYIFLLLSIFFFVHCSEDSVNDDTENPGTKKSKGVFICNEGNYTWGNASLSFYNIEKDTVENQIFNKTNNVPLGDVCQSMAIKDDFGFIVINNSGRIYVMNIHSNKWVATIDGLSSPRYIEFISDTKAYVSDLYNPNITIINPTDFSIRGQISIGKGTEQMCKYNNHVFAVSWSYNNKVYKIDSETDKLVDSLTITKQPNSIVLDKNNKLWVLSDGGFEGTPYGQDTAALTKIDPETMTVEMCLKFPTIQNSPSNLKINSEKDCLYFLSGGWGTNQVENSGVCKMSINETLLPTNPIIPENNRLFHSLGVDPDNSTLYVSNAIDYTQKGWIFRYTPQGTKIDSFEVDLIPGYFSFYDGE